MKTIKHILLECEEERIIERFSDLVDEICEHGGLRDKYHFDCGSCPLTHICSIDVEEIAKLLKNEEGVSVGSE